MILETINLHRQGSSASILASFHRTDGTVKRIDTGTDDFVKAVKVANKAMTAYHRSQIPSFEGASDHWMADTRPDWDESKRDHAIKMLARLKLSELRTPISDIGPDIGQIINARLVAKGYSDASISNTLYVMRQVFAYAYGRGWVRKVPIIAIKSRRICNLPVIPSADQLEAIYHMLPEIEQDIYWVTLFTGMGMGVVARLKWKDVSLEKGTILLPMVHDHNKRQEVPLCGEVSDIIHAYEGYHKKRVFGHTGEVKSSLWRDAIEDVGVSCFSRANARMFLPALLNKLQLPIQHIRLMTGYIDMQGVARLIDRLGEYDLDPDIYNLSGLDDIADFL